jgi:hypothetical protein
MNLRTPIASLSPSTPASAPRMSPANEPGTFVRLVSIPPTWPWRQTRAAELQARLGAPVAEDKLLYSVQRLEPWRPRTPCRFAILYARKDQVRDVYSTTLTIDGRELRFSLQPPSERQREQLLAAVSVGLCVGLGLATCAGVTTALEHRAVSSETLAELEAQSQAALKRAQVQARSRQDMQLLLGLGARDHSPSRVLEDLLWVSNHRRTDTGISAFHWESGLSAVEVEGDGDPFTAPDRMVERAAKPIRPGVWLWGVGLKRSPSPMAPSTSIASGRGRP